MTHTWYNYPDWNYIIRKIEVSFLYMCGKFDNMVDHRGYLRYVPFCYSIHISDIHQSSALVRRPVLINYHV